MAPQSRAEELTFLGRQLPRQFVLRVVTIDPGGERAYDPNDWAEALVVVERGRLQIESIGRVREEFDAGSIIYVPPSVRRLRSVGKAPLVLTAVTRRPSRGSCRADARPDAAMRKHRSIRSR